VPVQVRQYRLNRQLTVSKCAVGQSDRRFRLLLGDLSEPERRYGHTSRDKGKGASDPVEDRIAAYMNLDRLREHSPGAYARWEASSWPTRLRADLRDRLALLNSWGSTWGSTLTAAIVPGGLGGPFCIRIRRADGGSRTHTGLPPAVFELTARELGTSRPADSEYRSVPPRLTPCSR
jgi:hypothetical protein